MKNKLLTMAALLLAAVLTSQVFGAGKGNPNPGVMPINAEFQGLSYADLGALWWQWCFSIPMEGHPLFNGTDPFVNQPFKNVVFLGARVWPTGTPTPPGPIERSIKIPAGTAIYFPIANGELNFVETARDYPLAETIQDLYDIMAFYFDPLTDDDLYAIVDGNPLTNLTSYRVQSDVFDLLVPVPGSVLEAQGFDVPDDGYIYPVVADSFNIMLRPLPPGTHTLEFGVLSWDFHVKYTITVVPGKK